MADDLEADVNDCPTVTVSATACKDGVVETIAQPDCVFVATHATASVPEPESIFHDTLERYREEGRQEILQAIKNCWADDCRIERGDGYHCIFCGEGDINPHLTNCLWLKAHSR